MKGVVLLGLDGMSAQMLDQLAGSGVMPNASTFLAGNEPTPLLSTVPFFTIPGWATVFTGVLPGKHGLLWWRESDPQVPWLAVPSKRFTSLHAAHSPPLWRLLDDVGARQLILDVPGTFPAQPVDGVFVSGFLGPWPHPRAYYPPRLGRDVAHWIPSDGVSMTAEAFATGLPPRGAHRTRSLQNRVDDLTMATRQRLPLFEHAVVDSFDFAACVLVGPDRLSHLSFANVIPPPTPRTDLDRAVRQYWRAVDEYFRVLLRAREQGYSVVVCSDHGSSPASPLLFNVRRWLAIRGYVPHSKLARFMPTSLGSLLARGRPLAKRFVEQSDTLTTAVSWLRGLIKAYTWRTSGGRRHAPGADNVVFDVSMGDREVGLFVSPLVQGSPRQQILRRLVEQLAAQASEGMPVFEQVDLAARFLGKSSAELRSPDVIGVTAPYIGLATGSALQPLFMNNPDPGRGIHQREGVVVLSTYLDADLTSRAPRVEDLAPTVLSLLGYSPPSWMDGRSLVTPNSPGKAMHTENEPRPRVDASVTDEDYFLIENHLRDLGYLD